MDFTTIVIGAADIVLLFINFHLWKSMSNNTKIDIDELKLFVNKTNTKPQTPKDLNFFNNSKDNNDIFEQLKKPTTVQNLNKAFSETTSENTVNFDNDKTQTVPNETTVKKNFFLEIEENEHLIEDETISNETYNVMNELIKQVKSSSNQTQNNSLDGLPDTIKPDQLPKSMNFEDKDEFKELPKTKEKKEFDNRFPIAGDK
ncbi:MAG: hypothetical protein KAS30_05665 [Candidatus Diapherotrites archaeon]|nr:hypothetical protein [Candidatus Diapherotrites archaeon]